MDLDQNPSTSSNFLYNMQKETNKGRILGILLEAPKTTKELAHELGYIDKKGNALYNVINKDLKSLEERGYIESKREKLEKRPGNIPTYFSILYNYENLRSMLKEYPRLTSKLQKNDLVLESICKLGITRSYKIHTLLEDTGRRVDHTEGPEKPFSDEDKEDLKKKLRSSPEYFRLILLNHEHELLNNIEHLTEMLEKLEGDKTYNKSLERFNKYWPGKFRFGLDTFKACVSIDILTGQSNEEAEEYLIELEQKNKEAKEYLEKLKGS